MNLKADLSLLEVAVRQVVDDLKGRRKSPRGRHLYLVSESRNNKPEKRRFPSPRG